MEGLFLVTGPTVEPITLDDAKNFLRIDASDTSDDTLITALIKAARSLVEAHTNRALLTQTWDYWMDSFPPSQHGQRAGWWDGVREGALSSIVEAQGTIRLPKAPLQTVNSITYYDTTDTAQTTDLSTLVIQSEIEPAAIFPKIGQIWPVSLRGRQAVKVRFIAGYGDNATSLPGDIIQAVRILVAHFYENRGVMVESRLAEMPFSVQALLLPYRMMRLS